MENKDIRVFNSKTIYAYTDGSGAEARALNTTGNFPVPHISPCRQDSLTCRQRPTHHTVPHPCLSSDRVQVHLRAACFSLYVCLSVSFWLSVCLPLPVALSLYVSLSMSASVFSEDRTHSFASTTIPTALLRQAMVAVMPTLTCLRPFSLSVRLLLSRHAPTDMHRTKITFWDLY